MSLLLAGIFGVKCPATRRERPAKIRTPLRWRDTRLLPLDQVPVHQVWAWPFLRGRGALRSRAVHDAGLVNLSRAQFRGSLSTHLVEREPRNGAGKFRGSASTYFVGKEPRNSEFASLRSRPETWAAVSGEERRFVVVLFS